MLEGIVGRTYGGCDEYEEKRAKVVSDFGDLSMSIMSSSASLRRSEPKGKGADDA